MVDQERLNVPGRLSRQQSSSQLSDLAEYVHLFLILQAKCTYSSPRCPVCNSNLADLGDAYEQESHVKNCLDGGSGTTPQAAKYLVYKLPAESTLIGVECVICLEEFVKGLFHTTQKYYMNLNNRYLLGSAVARLSCLCSFHNGIQSIYIYILKYLLTNALFSLFVVLVAARQKLSGACSLMCAITSSSRQSLMLSCFGMH